MSREMLQLMQFSLMLQFALSQRTGRSQAFIDHTLADEIEQWTELADFARLRGAEIFAGKAPEGYREFVAGIENIAAYWELIVGRQASYDTTAAAYAQEISRPVAEARKILNTQFEQGHCERVKRGNVWVYVFSARTHSRPIA